VEEPINHKQKVERQSGEKKGPSTTTAAAAAAAHTHYEQARASAVNMVGEKSRRSSTEQEASRILVRRRYFFSPDFRCVTNSRSLNRNRYRSFSLRFLDHSCTDPSCHRRRVALIKSYTRSNPIRPRSSRRSCETAIKYADKMHRGCESACKTRREGELERDSPPTSSFGSIDC
jgi:hypothetical protein